jgi:(p)ppGpp synthase/HD superfamily hydrolase
VEGAFPKGPELSFLADLPLSRQAVAFAGEHHGGQRRESDGAPFLVHPLEAAGLLERAGWPDHVVAAAVLHDVLEDTDVEPAELRARFGRAVADLVELVSDDPAIDDEEQRKDEVRERVRSAGGDVLAVYAADKVSKVRELRMLIANGLAPEDAQVKVRRHRRSLKMLEQELPDSRLVEVLRFELEALEQLPPEPDSAAHP